jgi:hypothetical protein
MRTTTRVLSALRKIFVTLVAKQSVHVAGKSRKGGRHTQNDRETSFYFSNKIVPMSSRRQAEALLQAQNETLSILPRNNASSLAVSMAGSNTNKNALRMRVFGRSNLSLGLKFSAGPPVKDDVDLRELKRA